MKTDIEWYAKADLSKYKGKYVAILDKKVVASGTNAKKVFEEAKRRHPQKKSFLAKVMDDEPKLFNSMNPTEFFRKIRNEKSKKKTW